MYIIPQPQQFIFQGQNREEPGYAIVYDQKIVIDPSCGPYGMVPARLLQGELSDVLGFGLAITKGRSSKTAVCLSMDTQLGAEAYRLTVDKDGICAVGGGRNGLLYAVQTLRQILRQTGGMVPWLTIQDHPDIAHRGYYCDVTRGRIPTLDYLKQTADRLAFYKMNQLQLYIEHSFLFEGLSEVWRDDTPLCAEDILELDAYCTDLGIELVPSLSCFGHLYQVLRTRTFRHLCEMEQDADAPFGFADRMAHHTLDTSNTESLALIKGLIEEYLPLFTSSHFNIGADETFDLGKGKGKKRAEEIGADRMYIDFVKELCVFLQEKGKIPMFWGDIICHFPEAVQELPGQFICLNWGYAANQSDESVKKLAQAGAVQYTCPGVSGWNQFVNSLDTAYENIRRMCGYAREYGAVGVLNTDWGDFGHINHPEFSLPGIIYGAAFSWNGNIPSFDEMNRRISVIAYGDQTESLVGLAAQIPKNWNSQWGDLVKYKERRKPDFAADRLEGMNTSIRELQELTVQFYRMQPKLPKEVRQLVHAYLVAVQGMEIFGWAEIFLFGKEAEDGEKTASNGFALASRLEEWFYYYKELWRSVSRESELYRIQDVVDWYADRLRTKVQ